MVFWELFGICFMTALQEEMIILMLQNLPFIYPLTFCATRWVEDERVAERTVENWPNIEKYVGNVLKHSKSRQPNIPSLSTIRSTVQNPLTVTNLYIIHCQGIEAISCKISNRWSSDNVLWRWPLQHMP